MSCAFCGHPAVTEGLRCADLAACAERVHLNARTNPTRPRPTRPNGPERVPRAQTPREVHDAGFARMGDQIGKAFGLAGRWLMGEDLLQAVDAEHGTRLAPIAGMAKERLTEIRDEAERTIAVRDANVRAREQVTAEAKAIMNAPVPSDACEPCRGMGAKIEGGKAVVCAACQGSGKAAPKCDACNGDGAVLVETVGAKPRAQVCPTCKGTGQRGAA